MTSALLQFERRMSILSMLMSNRHITRRLLAEKLSVSYTTIGRDLSELSRYVPIYAKMGRNGGIYILDSYGGTRVYLSYEEERMLKDISENDDGDRPRIAKNILEKFSMPKVCQQVKTVN